MEAVLQFSDGAVLLTYVEHPTWTYRVSDGERITLFDLVRKPLCGPWVYRELESVN